MVAPVRPAPAGATGSTNAASRPWPSGSTAVRIVAVLVATLTALTLGATRADTSHAAELGAPCPDAAQVPFTDVTDERTHAASVGCIHGLGVTSGVTAELYGYDHTLRHGQLATFLDRALIASGALGDFPPFSRWYSGPETVHARSIERLYEIGVLDDLTAFDPVAAVTRAQMAAMVADALSFAGVLDDTSEPTVFDDLDGLDRADAIQRLGASRVVNGVGGGDFFPDAEVGRGQMATFLTNMLRFIHNGGQTLPEPPAPPPPPPPPPPVSRPAAEGWLIAAGNGPVVGTAGSLTRYTVEVADGLESREPLVEIATQVETVLSDTDHGWTSRGARRLQRVEDPSRAQIRVLIASPARVDRLCGQVGLRTNGRYSCWNGRFAALNAERWFDAVDHISDRGLYRTYLVNHEVGHGLGFGHRDCPGAGQLAPVMQQQTISLQGCRANGLPHP